MYASSRFLIVALAFVIAGCVAPGPLRMYDGAPLPREQVAVIQIPAYEFNSSNRSALVVLALDGRPIRYQNGRQPSELHILPGVRMLKVSYGLDLCCSGTTGGFAAFLAEVIVGVAIEERVGRLSEQELTLTAQAGRTYALHYSVRWPGIFRNRSGWKIDYWIEDLTDGRTVAGAKP